MKKRSLFAAVAMLIVSAVVLTSATYAWFASGSKADINEIKATISEKDGTLEIATITSGNDANWGVTLPYTAWLDSNGACITGSHGANLTESGNQAATILTPLSYDIATGTGIANMKKGHLVEITDPTDTNYKKYNFVTDGAATNADGFIDLKFYIRSSVEADITITPDFDSDIDFIYGAITAAPAYDANNEAAADIATWTAANQLKRVLGTSSTGYVPVVTSTSDINVLDANKDYVISQAEDTNANVVKTGASATISPDATETVTFHYSAYMASQQTPVECHMYIWAEGQDPTCHGVISSQNATLSVNISK